MLRLYYSEDQGLLDHEAYRFTAEHGTVEHVKGFNASDLELLLIQKNLDGNIDNLIVEHYEGSLEVLDNILNYSGVKNVLVLNLTKNLSPTIQKSLTSKGWQIEELPKLKDEAINNHFEKVLKLRCPHLTVSKEIRSIITSKMTSHATDINAVVENMASLDKTGDLNEQTAVVLAGYFRNDLDLWSLLIFYMNNDLKSWMSYIDDVIANDEEFHKFMYAWSKQLSDLKQYISLKQARAKWNDFTSTMSVPYSVIKGYGALLDKYGRYLAKWFNNFIIEWYIVQFSLVHSYSINCTLIKWFLLEQRRMLTSMGKIDRVG